MSRIAGANRLRRKLQRIGPEVSRGVKQSLLDGAEMMRRTALDLAPPFRRLRKVLAEPRAIGKKSGGFKVEFGIRTKRQKRDAFYAHWWEFGTKGFSGTAPKRARSSKKRPYRLVVPPIRPWHFLTGALEVNRRPFRRRRERAVNLALRRAAS